MRERWVFAGVAFTMVLFLGHRFGSADQGPNTLLCSDGRCGQSSKMSRDSAARDLNLWADKEELKNKLDELQTVMDRGMTHKAAAQQLNQYFNQLDHEADKQRRQALQQALTEGLVDQQALTEGPRVVSNGLRPRTEGLKTSPITHLHINKISGSVAKQHETSKLSAAAAVADLNSYFDSLPTSKKSSKVVFIFFYFRCMLCLD